VGKVAKKTVCTSVFLTIWHSISSAELSKTQSAFSAILHTGLDIESTVHIFPKHIIHRVQSANTSSQTKD